ncbi:MAG: nicotinate (nicotinamide) nucleotide adenylyltransferase [Anaerolineales bacterium]|nr:nicotinate (nicotinamide) nucleotide adenylyltransferase [Anaerolineales bacterium]
MGRIGVLGGSFDPPHLGHLALAKNAYDQLNLDYVLWTPAGQPPHKYKPTAARYRVAMIKKAIANYPYFCISRYDLDRPGPHFTYDLLLLLRNDLGENNTFWFLIGQDSLRDLADWYKPANILEICRLAVYPRQGYELDWEILENAVPGIQTKIDWLQGEPIVCSSRKIRQLVKENHSITNLVPTEVLAYIRENKLYIDSPDIDNRSNTTNSDRTNDISGHFLDA